MLRCPARTTKERRRAVVARIPEVEAIVPREPLPRSGPLAVDDCENPTTLVVQAPAIL